MLELRFDVMLFFQNFELETDKKENDGDSGLDSTGNSDEHKHTSS